MSEQDVIQLPTALMVGNQLYLAGVSVGFHTRSQWLPVVVLKAWLWFDCVSSVVEFVLMTLSTLLASPARECCVSGHGDGLDGYI